MPFTAEEKAARKLARKMAAEEKAFLKKGAAAAKILRTEADFRRVGGKDSSIWGRPGFQSKQRKRKRVTETEDSSPKHVQSSGVVGGVNEVGFFAVRGSLARYLRAAAAEKRKGMRDVVDLTDDTDDDDADSADSDDSESDSDDFHGWLTSSSI